jgi:hypothetical protein
LDKLLSIIAEMSTFRGEALKNRVLAAHPPDRPSGKRDDEVIAALPLASAAIVELYTNIVQNSPLFAPIVLLSNLETSEGVLQFLTDIRFVIEKERHCSGLWHHSVFRGFVKLSKNPSDDAQRLVRKVVARRQAPSQLSRRIDALLQKARATRDCGGSFSLQSVDEVMTVVLAHQACKCKLPVDFLDEIEALGSVSLVEAFAATQPGGLIDAIEFAGGEGAALMKDIMVPHARRWRDDISLLQVFVTKLITASHNSQSPSGEPNMHDTMRRLLSCPRVLPLVFRFWKSGEMNLSQLEGVSITSLLRYSIAPVDHDGCCEADEDAEASDAPKMQLGCMPVGDALAACGLQTRGESIALLEQALARNLEVQMEGGDFVPDGFMSPTWYTMAIPEIHLAIIATGLYSRREGQSNANENTSNTPNQNEVPATQAAVAQAIENALLTLCRHSWLVRNTWNSRHPFPNVKDIAVHLLVLGEHMAAALQSTGQADFGGAEAIAARFRNHWKSIFKMDGPPQDCPKGFHSCMYDGSCMSCGMPQEYCPSLFRLRIEIREFMARNRNDGDIGDVAEVTLNDASAVVTTIRGAQQFPDAPPIVQEAAAAMLDAGLLQKMHFSWGFSGPMRPVRFTCPDLSDVVLEMRPIT